MSTKNLEVDIAVLFYCNSEMEILCGNLEREGLERLWKGAFIYVFL